MVRWPGEMWKEEATRGPQEYSVLSFACRRVPQLLEGLSVIDQRSPVTSNY